MYTVGATSKTSHQYCDHRTVAKVLLLPGEISPQFTLHLQSNQAVQAARQSNTHR